MSRTYAAFIDDALCPDTGKVRNFMRFDRSWHDEGEIDDALGRAIWALGKVAAINDQRGLSSWAASRLLETAPSLQN
ncbi:hypothetical protein, partial [Glaesserella parasuis]|uniref:hypothetical protein n=1 Tax=Glaesserella parasuis TaxID=738 RepID=UPI003F336638